MADQTKWKVHITWFLPLTLLYLYTHTEKKTTTQKIPNQVCFFTYFPPSSFITFNSKDIHFNPLICRKVERIKATVNYYDSAAALWNLMFSIQSKFCINLFVALFQLSFAPSILLRYSGSVQNSLLLPVAEGKEGGEHSFIKEIINSSILDHKASLARATIFVQCLIVGNISGLNKPSNEQF